MKHIILNFALAIFLTYGACGQAPVISKESTKVIYILKTKDGKELVTKSLFITSKLIDSIVVMKNDDVKKRFGTLPGTTVLIVFPKPFARFTHLQELYKSKGIAEKYWRLPLRIDQLVVPDTLNSLIENEDVKSVTIDHDTILIKTNSWETFVNKHHPKIQ
jgi:hypothetical protein